MEKTITMIMSETRMKLVATCNESRLPACVLEMLVKELHTELKAISENQLQQETNAYHQALAEKEHLAKEGIE